MKGEQGLNPVFGVIIVHGGKFFGIFVREALEVTKVQDQPELNLHLIGSTMLQVRTACSELVSGYLPLSVLSEMRGGGVS